MMITYNNLKTYRNQNYHNYFSYLPHFKDGNSQTIIFELITIKVTIITFFIIGRISYIYIIKPYMENEVFGVTAVILMAIFLNKTHFILRKGVPCG